MNFHFDRHFDISFGWTFFLQRLGRLTIIWSISYTFLSCSVLLRMLYSLVYAHIGHTFLLPLLCSCWHCKESIFTIAFSNDAKWKTKLGKRSTGKSKPEELYCKRWNRQCSRLHVKTSRSDEAMRVLTWNGWATSCTCFHLAVMWMYSMRHAFYSLDSLPPFRSGNWIFAVAMLPSTLQLSNGN